MRMERLREHLRRQAVSDRRLADQQREAAVRGEARHHEIDERFAIIEANTARIGELERRLDEHIADKKGHK